MEPVGSTYAALSAADLSAVRSAGGRLAGKSAAGDLPAFGLSTGGNAGSQISEQQGVQLTKQPAEEFKPYSSAAEQKSRGTQSGEQSPGTTGAGNSVTAQDPQVQAAVAQLKATEEKVKAHEAAHKSAGGALTGPVSYTYTRGPDGRNYITGGEVPIAISTGRTPQETISRMQQVIQAALAPADPSPQDRAVAAQAAAIQQEARQDQTAASGQTTPESSPAVSSSSTNQADSTTARNAERSYGSQAAAGQKPSLPAGEVTSPDSRGSARSETIGLTPSGLTPADIAGFGSSRPVSYYA